MVAIGVWLLNLVIEIKFFPYGGILFWHAHEMVFGFTSAVIVGFLLTAVQSWTGIRATHGKPLILITAVWLVGRVLIAVQTGLSSYIVAFVDLGFLALSIGLLGGILFKAEQKRNYIMLVILSLLLVSNIKSH